jgi:hypothetical protein
VERRPGVRAGARVALVLSASALALAGPSSVTGEVTAWAQESTTEESTTEEELPSEPSASEELRATLDGWQEQALPALSETVSAALEVSITDLEESQAAHLEALQAWQSASLEEREALDADLLDALAALSEPTETEPAVEDEPSASASEPPSESEPDSLSEPSSSEPSDLEASSSSEEESSAGTTSTSDPSDPSTDCSEYSDWPLPEPLPWDYSPPSSPSECSYPPHDPVAAALLSQLRREVLLGLTFALTLVGVGVWRR